MDKVLEYVKRYRKDVIWGICMKFGGTLLELGIPWVLSYIIDRVIPMKKISLVFIWGLVMILFSVGAALGNICANRVASKSSMQITRDLRHDLFNKILHLSKHQVDTITLPSLVSRMTTDTYNIHHAVGMLQRMGVRTPVIVLGSFFVMFSLDKIMTLVLLLIIPINILFVYYITSHGIPLFQKQQKNVDNMVRTVREDYTGIRVIKALSKEKYEKKHFEVINEQLVKSEKKASVYMAITNPLMNLMFNVGMAVVILIGAFRLNRGGTTIGCIMAFNSYFMTLLAAMMGITRIFVMTSKALASSSRVKEILELPEELVIASKEQYPVDKSFFQDSYAIKFNHVTFRYHGEHTPSLSDISFQLKKGESLGIIGATGSGKSTLVNLLLRFYDTSEGEIYINGENIKTISGQKMREKMGVVFQSDFVCSGTLRENIAFGRKCEEENLKLAILTAQANELVELDVDGLEKRIYARGNNLSGGQKQRLLLSRALAAVPEILILDDSSSALDYKTDARFRKCLQKNYPMITQIMIAQRISSIMDMDHILVLEGGRIESFGTHEELMQKCKVYRELYELQTGGDIDVKGA